MISGFGRSEVVIIYPDTYIYIIIIIFQNGSKILPNKATATCYGIGFGLYLSGHWEIMLQDRRDVHTFNIA